MARLAALVAAGALGGAILVVAGGEVHGYCRPRGSLPDPLCTPGSWITHDRATVCAAGYRPRAVGPRSKRIVLRDYGISDSDRPRYRLVALVPQRLGGSRRVTNLWPLARGSHPGPAEKRQLDLTLRSVTCSGRLGVAAAQRAIARDWVSAYRRLVRVPASHR
jgi:hypothetical protein